MRPIDFLMISTIISAISCRRYLQHCRPIGRRYCLVRRWLRNFKKCRNWLWRSHSFGHQQTRMFSCSVLIYLAYTGVGQCKGRNVTSSGRHFAVKEMMWYSEWLIYLFGSRRALSTKIYNVIIQCWFLYRIVASAYVKQRCQPSHSWQDFPAFMQHNHD